MKNKLAASTLAFQGWELKDTLQCCRDNGIDAVEIRMDFHPWSVLSLSDYTYKEIQHMMEAYGIEVSDLGTGIRMNRYGKEGLEQLRRCSEIANILQCRGMRIMLGNKRKFLSDKVPGIDFEGLVKWLTEADDILDGFGTQIWIETHDEFATGREQRRLLDAGNFRNIRLLWDIMHPLEAGEKPEDTLNYMGNELAHVHIKDGEPWDDPDRSSWKYTRIGEGIVPIKDIVKLIKDSGYEGYFSLEWESSWRPEIRGEGYEIPEMIRQFRRVMDACQNE